MSVGTGSAREPTLGRPALLKLKDWTGLIYKHPLQARAIVKKFVPGRFVFTPVRAGSAKLPRYEVTATANPSLILGAVLPALVPPATGPRGSGAGASQIGGDPGGKHAPGASRGGRADLLAPLGWSLEVDLATTITVDAA